jgi:hypothetical protein
MIFMPAHKARRHVSVARLHFGFSFSSSSSHMPSPFITLTGELRASSILYISMLPSQQCVGARQLEHLPGGQRQDRKLAKSLSYNEAEKEQATADAEVIAVAAPGPAPLNTPFIRDSTLETMHVVRIFANGLDLRQLKRRKLEGRQIQISLNSFLAGKD